MSWKGRYLCRLLTRAPVRSLLSLVLAALLAFAFGVLTVLRGIYGEAYRNVDVWGVFYGGLPYTAAQKLEKSGLVRDPGYEYINRDCEIEYHGGTLYFVSGILRFAQGAMVVHINSRILMISATKIPALADMPRPFTDMRNPPSRPPN